jgi:hypothetical protein
MIELKHDRLCFSFPEVHKDARTDIAFQRTLRIPDDENVHYLPPGLGNFPMRHVDDFAERVPESWLERGGVMLPMFQSEAMWISFQPHTGYPFLIKVAAGKINAVTGEDWTDGVNRDPQDYMTVPTQPWLDGYCIKKGEIRQFVAMPLGEGYTAEEQLTGKAEHGGIQLIAHPMKAEEWEKLRKQAPEEFIEGATMICDEMMLPESAMEMGLAPGGKMKQEIYDDPYDFDVWDLRHSSRCFVHIANSIAWRAITGEAPPTMPPTAKQYSEAGLPWFDYYEDDVTAVEGGDKLKGLKSVLKMSKEKGETVLPENEGVDVKGGQVIKLGKKVSKDQVREGRF